jgi:mannose-1-phosphate guanylyltransferase
MHLILLSGGSGKRLWPLSNDVRSKQFLKLLKDEKDNAESMVQRVYRQIKEVGGWDSITVAASASQRDMLALQLGEDVNVVIEPERRDTFPAIALACSYLYSEKKVAPDEAIAVLPVDPYVDLDYFIKVSDMEKVILQEKETDLVLLGALPTFPTEKYGYIVCEENGFDVSRFKEKPTVSEAQQLIDQGALWNCGVFGLKLGYVLDILKEKYGVEDFRYSAMAQTFLTLKKTSFDYEIVEKAKNIKAIKYENTWMDLGTWQTITMEMKNSAEGNVITDDACRNTHIINDIEMPIVAMGIEDAVIVASNDGILVAKKDRTSKLKDMISGVNNRPMYERKSWGKYKVYENNAGALTKKLIIEEGKQISYQYHAHRKEVWTILSGEGILYLDGVKSKVSVGDVIKIDENMKHGIKAVTQLEIIEVQIGDKLEEEDIVRINMEW